MRMIEQKTPSNFARFAWIVVALNLVVIVWGGFVSASGSGDGCGASWPLCEQLVSSETRSWQTFVEFSHRMTSGLALIGVLGLIIGSYRRFPKDHIVRRGAMFSLIFILVESLLGAALVIFKWVDTNLSLARAFVQPVHLTNTFLLMAALCLTAWWATRPDQTLTVAGKRKAFVALGIALAGLVLVSSFGTIASLASTIFPSESFLAGVQKDFARNVHYLVRLRIWHPILALVIGRYLLTMGQKLKDWFADEPLMRKLVNALLVIYGVQFALGSLNAILLAPIWLQLVHLLIAHLLWLCLVGLAALVLAQEEAVWEQTVLATT